MTDDRIGLLETAIVELQEVRRNLVAANGAQALALTVILRLLVTKGVSSAEEITQLLLGSLASLPENEQQGVVGQILRGLANLVTAIPQPTGPANPTRH